MKFHYITGLNMIKITLEDQVTKRLASLSKLQLTRLLPQIGEILLLSTKQRFSSKTAPDGSKWAKNSDSTIKLKGSDNALIGETKSLANQIHYAVNGRELELSSSLPYASTQQFGAKRGAFGTHNKRPTPWGDIPARPFFGISKDDQRDITALIKGQIKQTLK